MGSKTSLESFRFGPRQVFDPARYRRADLDVAPEPSFRIDPRERVFVIGSCFAARIRDALRARGVDATDGGLDLKYNVFSMVQALSWALAGEVDARLVAETRGGWVNPHHHPGTPVRTEEEALGRLVAALERTQAELPGCRTVVFTLGLVECWYDTATDTWTNESPPVASLVEPDRYEFVRTGHAANLAGVLALVRTLHAALPGVRFVGTVSPVPLKATFAEDDVLVANCYSKSALRSVLGEAIDTLHAEGVTIDYFPSYELVTQAPQRDAVWRATWPDGSPDGRHVCADFVERVIVPTFLERWLDREGARKAG